MKSANKVIALLVGAVMLIALVALGVAVSFWTYGQIEQANNARKNTRLVIYSVNNLLSMLTGAETAQRGYLLTGDEVYLEPYKAAHKDINTHLASLHQLIQISAALQHLEAMTPLFESKMAELKQVIELRRKNDRAAALAIVRSGQGKEMMDEIRGGRFSVEYEASVCHHGYTQSAGSAIFIRIYLLCLSGNAATDSDDGLS
jgi:two-component system, NarL family, sensor histidine kinase EvgS